MNKLALRQAALLVLIAMVLLVPAVMGGWYVMRKHARAQDMLAQLESRHARLLGLESQRAELETARQRAAALREQYVYPATGDEAQTGNQVQQKVRDTMTAAGLQVISSQVLPAKEEKGFDRIRMVVNTEGEILGVQSALAVLSSQQPVIIIDELSINVMGALANNNPKLPSRLSAHFSLSVLRERP